jgi:membrane protein required for beta-lactamase induction
MHFCYVLDTNNVFLTCAVHCQNIYYLSKQSGIETFLAVAVRVMGWMNVVQALLLLNYGWDTREFFFLLFALLVVGFNHIDMKHSAYSAT